MTEKPLLLPAIDSDPDEWVDEHPEPTEEEIAEGNCLGETIDVDNDADIGVHAFAAEDGQSECEVCGLEDDQGQHE